MFSLNKALYFVKSSCIETLCSSRFHKWHLSSWTDAFCCSHRKHSFLYVTLLMKSLHLITHVNIYNLFSKLYSPEKGGGGRQWTCFSSMVDLKMEEMEGRSREEECKYEDINRREKTEWGSWAVRESRNKFSLQLLRATAIRNNNTQFLPLSWWFRTEVLNLSSHTC